MKELIDIRIKNNMTQQDMADFLEVSFSYYTKIEKGLKTPSYNFLIKLKKKFPELDMNIFLIINNTNSVKK